MLILFLAVNNNHSPRAITLHLTQNIDSCPLFMLPLPVPEPSFLGIIYLDSCGCQKGSNIIIKYNVNLMCNTEMGNESFRFLKLIKLLL
jgi:hypothetical protein